MATLATRFSRAIDFHNPNQVKVVIRAMAGRCISRVPGFRFRAISIWRSMTPG